MRCMALPIVAVRESIADKFVDMIVEKAKKLKIGCSYDPETEMGALVV